MCSERVYTAIGLMAGTSLDGEIDVALIRTDGENYADPLEFKTISYDKEIAEAVRACFGKREPDEQTKEAERLVTEAHINAVKKSGFTADIIGFHGQTITHDPEQRFTWQLGDGQKLAKETGMDVVYQFRQSDMKVGGQGAPLLPLYHSAVLQKRELPFAVLNLGGIANVTYIGKCFKHMGESREIIAFDTGPANVLINDYIKAKTGEAYDKDGAFALAGQPDQDFLNKAMKHPYFKEPYPKSLDRNDFEELLKELPDDFETAVASLTEFTVQSVARSVEQLPDAPKEWLVCGGGRNNEAIMQGLRKALNVPVERIETARLNGDATEAQGFAYLAVRSLKGLPLTLPTTTGVEDPTPGGVLCKALEQAA